LKSSLLFLLLISTSVHAIDTSARGDVLLLGSERWIHATSARTDHTSVTDGILIGGADLAAGASGWSLDARPEIRMLWSESVGSKENSADRLSLKGPKRWADLSTHISDTNRTDGYLDWERATLSYRDSEIEALVGRKIFSAGVLKLFPVWNKFSRPLPFLPSPLLLYGQDQIAASAQRGSYTLRTALLAESERKDNTYWLEGGWLPAQFELHALAAYWWQQRVYGVSAAADLWGATWRGESLLISPQEARNSESQTQLGFGVERLLGEKWTATAEAFFQDAGVEHKADYRLTPPTRFSPLRARWYSALQLAYQAKETLIVSASALVNHLDGSVFAALKIDDSLTGNSNLVFEIKGPLGREGGEFSTSSLHFPDDSRLGAPSQLSVSYKRFF
jgi:hypothetical protein